MHGNSQMDPPLGFQYALQLIRELSIDDSTYHRVEGCQRHIEIRCICTGPRHEYRRDRRRGLERYWRRLVHLIHGLREEVEAHDVAAIRILAQFVNKSATGRGVIVRE